MAGAGERGAAAGARTLVALADQLDAEHARPFDDLQPWVLSARLRVLVLRAERPGRSRGAAARGRSAEAPSKTSAEAQRKVKARYPEAQLDIILQLGADAAFAAN